jgi:hypothetical protein
MGALRGPFFMILAVCEAFAALLENRIFLRHFAEACF